MKFLAIILPMLVATVSGCCGGCSKFLLDVQRGMYYEEKPHAMVQSVVERSLPASFTSTARVVLRRGGGENAFRLKLRWDAPKDLLRIAAVTDLGNVIFSVASKGSETVIVKNNSGWSDRVILESIVPVCRQITIRNLSKDSIVQKFPSGRYCYRTLTPAMELVEIHLNQTGDRVATFVTRRFAWFGEKEYVRRVHVAEYATFGDSDEAWPKRLEIIDEIAGYRADVRITDFRRTD